MLYWYSLQPQEELKETIEWPLKHADLFAQADKKNKKGYYYMNHLGRARL
jgi:SpoVK/Ycf46/Vps4 family AAA+-type ATPase